MKLNITKIFDPKNYDAERVLLEVTEDCNLHFFIIIDTTYYPTTKRISNKLRHTYWFPNQDVLAGDTVALYTKKGINTARKNPDGITTTYTLYWGLGNSVWNNDGDAAVLFEISEWATTTTSGQK